MEATTEVPLICGSAHPELNCQIADKLGLVPIQREIGASTDGDVRVHVVEDFRGATVAIVQPTGPPVNDYLMVLALLADAARAAGAGWIVAVVPSFGYARRRV